MTISMRNYKKIMPITIASLFITLTGCSDEGDTDEVMDVENNETETDVMDGVVVDLENSTITKEELFHEMAIRNGESVLREMVLVRILEEEYDFQREKIDDEIELIKSSENLDSDIEFMDYLERSNMTMDNFEYQVKSNTLIEKASEDLAEFSDDDVMELYEQQKVQRDISHILLYDEEQGETLIEKLDEGADFADLAGAYSEDTGTSDHSGRLGMITKGQMFEPVDDIIFGLEVGETSDLLETDLGIHIVKVHAEETYEFEELEESLTSQVRSASRFDYDEIFNHFIESHDFNVLFGPLEGSFEEIN